MAEQNKLNSPQKAVRELTRLEGKIANVSYKNHGVQIGDTWINEVPEEIIKQFGRDDEIEVEYEIKDSDRGPRKVYLKLVRHNKADKDEANNFPEYLDRAHSLGRLNIRTSMLYNEPTKHTAVFEAIVRIQPHGKEEEETYYAHGDTDEASIPKNMFPHYLRFAETRAIARALRWATNENRRMPEAKK